MLSTLTTHQRLRYTKIAISFSLVVIFAISYKLWLNGRNFPLVPVLDFFPVLPAPFDYVQVLLPVMLLVLIATSRKASGYIYFFFILFWLLVLGDQNRLQPYCYMYAFMLLVIAGNKYPQNEEQQNNVLNALRLIVIGTYFWAAVHKVNPHFLERFYPFITGASQTPSGFEKYFILLVPLTELFVALGFMFTRTRRLALYLAVFMHFAIIVVLVPRGWNYVVIPWNVGLIIVNVLLFSKTSDLHFFDLWQMKKSFMKMAVVLLFFIMPAFNLFGFWDHYVSASLYTFKAPYAAIRIDQPLKEKLPAYLEPYYRSDERGTYIEVAFWAIGEMHVLPYPEERVYQGVKDFVCNFDTRDSCYARLQMYH